MDDKIKNLLKLINENPELPIIPMVDSDVVQSEDYGYWQGSWGDAEIREFVGYQMYGDAGTIVYKDDMEDLIEYILDHEGGDEKQAEKTANALDWVKAIIVSINLPT